MTAVLLAAMASVLSGVTLFVVRVMFNSRQSMGERIGRLEDAQKFEEGRRAGIAEAKQNERGVKQ